MSRPMHANIVRLFEAIFSVNPYHRRPIPPHSRAFSSQQQQESVKEEHSYNFYNIRDSREKTLAKGFHKNDPRANWTNRDDVTLDMDISNFGEDEELLNETFPRLAGLNVRPRVDLRNVCKSIKALEHYEIVDAIKTCVPHYSKFKSVKELYLYIKSKDAINRPRLDAVTRQKLTALKEQINNLSKVQTFGLKESLFTLLMFHDLKLLDYGMANALCQSVQLQLYAFRPFDVAAAISIYGQFPGGFNPLINVLGIVFYDMLIGGKTSICANGVTPEELLAVACALGDSRREVKKVTDAIFGSIYKRINEFSTPMLVAALDSFFVIAKNHNFVEFYTIVLSRALQQPLLYVDRFQEHIQEQLNTQFDIPSHSCKLLECNQPLEPASIPRLLKALANCESEFLISSVHWRIEFKRLWSENIRSGNLPWQTCAKEREYKFPPFTGSDKMVTYKSLMPPLYESIQKVISDYILGTNIPTCNQVAKRIVEVNAKVLECCKGILDNGNIHSHGDVVVGHLHETHYPLVTNLRRILVFGNEDVLDDENMGNCNYEALPAVTIEFSSKNNKPPPLNKSAINVHANFALARYGCKSSVEGIPSYTAWLTEFKNEVAMGNVTTLDYQSHANFLNLAHCIKVVNDYSRYILPNKGEMQNLDVTHIDVLANLYHRLLFYIPPTSTTKQLENAAVETLKYISPSAIFLENKHLALVTTGDLVGSEEYINTSTSASDSHYYKPYPAFLALYQGRGDLYGILCYTMASRMQYLSTGKPQWLKVYNLPSAIQHLLHPIYAFTRLDKDPFEVWSVAYYSGVFVNVDNYLSNDTALTTLKAKVREAMARSLSDATFQQLFVAAINTIARILREIEPFIGVDTRLDYIRALVMLQHCVCFMRRWLVGILADVINGKSLMCLCNVIGDEIFQKVTVTTDEQKAVSFKVSEHIKLLEAIVMSIDILQERELLYKLLHQCLILAYKRQQYFSLDYLIRYSAALACIEKHFGTIELDEPLENINQLVVMFKRDAMEAIAKHERHTDDDPHLKEPEKRYLLHILNSSSLD